MKISRHPEAPNQDFEDFGALERDEPQLFIYVPFFWTITYNLKPPLCYQLFVIIKKQC